MIRRIHIDKWERDEGTDKRGRKRGIRENEGMVWVDRRAQRSHKIEKEVEEEMEPKRNLWVNGKAMKEPVRGRKEKERMVWVNRRAERSHDIKGGGGCNEAEEEEWINGKAMKETIRGTGGKGV